MGPSRGRNLLRYRLAGRFFVTKVGLVVPTLNGGQRWVDCIRSIETQSLAPSRLLNVDSSSTDGTVTRSKMAGFEVIEIARSEFNHGGTRQWAAEHLNDCEIVVFLTQDAVLASTDALLNLIASFNQPNVALAYGRQVPHFDASAIEAHARIFNYGSIRVTKDLDSARELGPKVFFCSNSFAAYRRAVLVELGGFRNNLILGEDMEFAARAVKAGYANIYCAAALAYHSHDYSFGETLRRYFDIGAFDEMNRWMREYFGSHTGEGLRYISSELRYLRRNAPLQIPRALVLTAAKLIGYRIGRMQRSLPKNVKRKLSMMPGYWR